MKMTTFRFDRGVKGMNVVASYDRGWNEGLQCAGTGGWSDEVSLNDDGAALFRISNGKSQLSICGMTYIRGMMFSVVPLSETVEGFEIDQDDNGITVVCKGVYRIEYQPVEMPPRR